MASDRHYTQERCELAKCYPGKGWLKKVSQMSDAQVHEVLVSIRTRKEKKNADKVQERTA